MGRTRIAIVISGGDLFSRRGVINAAIQRIVALKAIASYEIDVYYLLIEQREFHIRNIFRHDGFRREVTIDGVKIKIIWHIEYYSTLKIFRTPLRWMNRSLGLRIRDLQWIKRLSGKFHKYRLISAHSSEGADLGRFVRERYGTPYFVTWHGSDIHTQPFLEQAWMDDRICSIENAACNFFVSSALKKTSEEITPIGRRIVLYNGVDRELFHYENEKKILARQQHSVDNMKVVTFVGNLRPIKNADLLPAIFKEIKNGYEGDIKFWIIGDGVLFNTINDTLSTCHINCELLGNIPPADIPEYLNCTDVLILPSRNEGLPLVLLEALASGANAVGTNIGGIPEIIGEDFCVPLSDNFVSIFAKKVISVLINHPDQPLKEHFSWGETARIENDIYCEFLTDSSHE